jgi:citrate lyase beta subunit
MFDAQQVIHPNQVVTVNSSFVPTFHGAAHVLSQISITDDNMGCMSIGI